MISGIPFGTMDAERRAATSGACDGNGHRGDGRGHGDLRALGGNGAAEGTRGDGW